MRTVFKLTDEQMTPIEATKEEKQEYFDLSKKTIDAQHEEVVDLAMLKAIIAVSPLCDLMVRSGLRISEVLDNKAKFTKKKVMFRLNKKAGNDFYEVHIIGSVGDWIKKYHAMKEAYKDRTSKQITDSVNIKLKKILPVDFYKRSSHICRAIYIRYLYKFRTADCAKWTFPQIISKFLHHDNPTAAVYYQHIILSDDVVDFLR